MKTLHLLQRAVAASIGWLLLSHVALSQPAPTMSANTANPFQITGLYPVFTVKAIGPTIQFYQDVLGFRPVFVSSWFVLLNTPQDPPQQLGFLIEDWPEAPKPPRLRAMKGEGAYLTLDVKDAKAALAAATASGQAIVYPLTDEPWGQRRFVIRDPNGIYLDIVEAIEPKAGYWERYMPQE